MKFISFAILSALATLTTAAPAPSQGQCVPEQGQQYDYDYDMTGWGYWNDCAGTSLQVQTGVFKTHSAYNFVETGSSFTYCGKYRSHTAGAKAVDAQGNRYNLILQNGGSYDSTYSKTTWGWESDDKYSYKFKLVGQGRLANSVVTYTYNCHSSYDPVTGVYHQDCKTNEGTAKCSA